MLYLNRRNVNLLPAGHHDSHAIIIMSGIIMSLLVVILALVVANSRMSFFGRAATTSSVNRIGAGISLDNSYLFASPLSAAADGSSIVRVTAIILDEQGLGIANQQVILKSEGQLTIASAQPLTDTFGRAIFDVTASSPGDYKISASLPGGSLPQTVSVSFH